jgi:uncharacterized protein
MPEPPTPGTEFTIKVTPKARRNAVEPDGAGGFRIWTTTAPENGKANAAVLALLADHLGMAKSRLEVVRGATSRAKVVRVVA